MLKKVLGSLLVMLFTTAAYSGHHSEVQFMNSPDNIKKGYPFSELVKAGNTLYLAGQLGFDPKTGKLATGGIADETKFVMENIKSILTKNGYSMQNLVKCTVMLADIAEWGAFNEVYKTYFEAGQFPARSAFAASGLALNAKVEVECIGFAGK